MSGQFNQLNTVQNLNHNYALTEILPKQINFFLICEIRFGLMLLYQVMRNNSFLSIFLMHHQFIFSCKMWKAMYHSNLSGQPSNAKVMLIQP